MQKIIVFLLCSLMAAPALAEPLPRTITVYGESSKEVSPDEAAVTVTVNAKNRDLKVAKAEHDKKLETLFKIAGDMQIERKHLKTQHAAVQPIYRYTDNERVFEGYEVSTMLEISLQDIDQTGLFMQKLVDAKFDQIGNVQYRVDDDLAYRDAVLVEALDNARAKAEKLAERAEGTLGPVLNITQGYSQPQLPQPMVQGRMMAMEAKADFGGGVTPPEGMMRISGTVTVMYELK